MAAKTGKVKASKKTLKAEPLKNGYKKLYRSKTRLLGGVCAGLAEFLDLDPSIIRLIFIIVTLLGGSGILIYILLWLIIPEEGQPAEITEEKLRATADEMKSQAMKLGVTARQYSQNYSRRHSPRTTVGIILIILGVFFMLQNLGLFRFSFIWKFWPVILIAFAIYIIGKND